jgi:hypothetical protein
MKGHVDFDLSQCRLLDFGVLLAANVVLASIAASLECMDATPASPDRGVSGKVRHRERGVESGLRRKSKVKIARTASVAGPCETTLQRLIPVPLHR